jgi:hypothetical protein
MPDKNSQSNHKNRKQRHSKSVSKNAASKKNQAAINKLVAFENSVAGKSDQADLKRASFLFNNLQRQIIKTRIARIHLN